MRRDDNLAHHNTLTFSLKSVKLNLPVTSIFPLSHNLTKFSKGFSLCIVKAQYSVEALQAVISKNLNQGWAEWIKSVGSL